MIARDYILELTAPLPHRPPQTPHSYTWRGEGITLVNGVAAIEAWLAANPDVDPGTVALFIDVLVCAQHRGLRPGSGTCPNATDVGKFKEVIEECERLVLYATPITQPKALSRVWCLYELMSARKGGKPVGIALSPDDQEELRRLLLEDLPRLEAMFTTIKSENAEATISADRDMIFGWVKHDLGPNGFLELDQLVAEGMREWLAETAKALVDEEGGEDGEADEADVVELMDRCGTLLQDLARFDEAEPLLRRALEINEATLGPDHPDTGDSAGNLGSLLKDKGDLDAAEPLMRRALEIDEAALGPDHTSTGISAGNLGSLLEAKGDLDAAEPLMRRGLEIDEAALGPDHPETGNAMGNLGLLLKEKGDYDAAEPLMRRALDIEEAALG